jgi:hypothetical protein
MSNMTPFEIRLELLKMAKDMLESDYFGKKDRINNQWNIECSLAADNNQNIPKCPEYPDYPSEQEIISKANELNKFISNTQ